MKISEYIKCLEVIQRDHGDLEVHTTVGAGERRLTLAPSVGWKMLLGARQVKPRWWDYREYAERGEKLCKVL